MGSKYRNAPSLVKLIIVAKRHQIQACHFRSSFFPLWKQDNDLKMDSELKQLELLGTGISQTSASCGGRNAFQKYNFKSAFYRLQA